MATTDKPEPNLRETRLGWNLSTRAQVEECVPNAETKSVRCVLRGGGVVGRGGWA